ncbi:MAG: class I SAM-dependent methyltransferase [Armatimonadetes bacterium]|nr:class I SAM-dependent methyltransferase [Armatimonadota bacterium]
MWIPWEEAPRRIAEFPPPGSELALVSGALDEARAWAASRWKLVEAVQSDAGGPLRLWKPSAAARWIAEHAPSRVVDLGCGQGRDAVFLADLGWEVVAIDHLSECRELVENLRLRYAPEGRIQVRIGDVKDLLLAEPYPYVLASRLHLKGLLEVLQPWTEFEGFAAIEVAPNKQGPESNSAWEITPLSDGLWAAQLLGFCGG